MPEFPDVTVYIEALAERILNQPIQKIRVGSPFVLRSFDPPIVPLKEREFWRFAASASASYSLWKTNSSSSFIS